MNASNYGFREHIPIVCSCQPETPRKQSPEEPWQGLIVHAGEENKKDLMFQMPEFLPIQVCFETCMVCHRGRQSPAAHHTLAPCSALPCQLCLEMFLSLLLTDDWKVTLREGKKGESAFSFPQLLLRALKMIFVPWGRGEAPGKLSLTPSLHLCVRLQMAKGLACFPRSAFPLEDRVFS